MRRHRFAGRDAGLLERGFEAACRPHFLARRGQHGMRFQPVERKQPQPPGNRRAFVGIGDQVEPVAVANLVERQAMRGSRSPNPPFEQFAVADPAQASPLNSPERFGRKGQRGLGFGGESR